MLASVGLMEPDPAKASLRVPEWGALQVASVLEDSLLEVKKQIEASMDTAVSTMASALAPLPIDASNTGETAAQELVKEVWDVVDNNYLDVRGSGFDRALWAQLRDKALRQAKDTPSAHRAIRQMLAAGLKDPYTRFVSPQEFVGMRKYDITGIGLNLCSAEEFTTKTESALPVGTDPSQSGGVYVLGIIKSSASDKAGVQQGYELLEVNGRATAGSTPFQVASMISAAASDAAAAAIANPTLQLKMRTLKGAIADVQLPLSAAPIVSSPVSFHMQSTGPFAALFPKQTQPTGYIRLSSLNARAQKDVAAAVAALTDAGAQQLVLDLRDNRGGLVQEGIEVAKLFLEGNVPVVLTEGKAMTSSNRAVGSALTQLPMMVLVNEHTASASEILAGALRDNCRATLVGSQTFGKGLIQSVYELSDSSGLIITVGKYLTPAGTDIDRYGLEPDFRRMPSPQVHLRKIDACRINRVAPV